MFQSLNIFNREKTVVSDRDLEKAICGSGTNSSEGQTCHVTFGTIKLQFSWIWSVMSDQFQRALNQPADLIIFNVGSHYIFSDAFSLSEVPELVATQAIELLNVIAKSDNQNFVFRTSTRVCADGAYRNHPAEVLNEMLMTVNDILVSVLSDSDKVR